MDAISLWQPWATLIAIGAKQYETRHWRPPPALIGKRIAIAATKTQPEGAAEIADDDGPIARALAAAGIDPHALPAAAVVATARLLDVYRTETVAFAMSGNERAFGNFAPGRFAWRLDELERIEPPIACRGAQGLWQWDPNAPPAARPLAKPSPQGRLL
jgi:hypothetical protein